MDLWEWLMMLECIMKLKKKKRNVGSPAQVGLQREAFRDAQATTLGAVSSSI